MNIKRFLKICKTDKQEYIKTGTDDENYLQIDISYKLQYKSESGATMEEDINEMKLEDILRSNVSILLCS